MISISNLTVSYGKNVVLSSLEAHFDGGKIHGVVGLNASGKTTLFNTLYGFIKPDSGTIMCNNANLKRKDIGYMESSNYFYPYLTGEEYLRLFKCDAKSTIDFDKLIDMFQIPVGRPIENYSAGMQKKLAFVSILMLNRKILMLDEPFNSLDTESTYILQQVLLRLKLSGLTILLSSHIFEPLINICDEMFYLANGKCVKMKSKHDLSEIENDLNIKYQSLFKTLFHK